MGKRSRPSIQQKDDFFDSNKRSRPPKQHQKEEKLISPGMSSKIMKEALMQQKEIQDEAEKQNPNSFFAITEEPNVDLDEEEELDGFDGFSETLSHYDGYEEEIDEEEERILEGFMSKNAGPQRTLADLIIEKIKEKDVEVSSEDVLNIEREG
ncbi:hypothetical protein HHK36_006853 [Tetracentron sinense]|uniref:Bystin n=1 Tax=Tetracentron sinense TaxID=13715 RepID=A0A835DKQ9_TETSI|nr:hypothetical protein HHK36_006853 [Tetracentron sinense]